MPSSNRARRPVMTAVLTCLVTAMFVGVAGDALAKGGGHRGGGKGGGGGHRGGGHRGGGGYHRGHYGSGYWGDGFRRWHGNVGSWSSRRKARKRPRNDGTYAYDAPKQPKAGPTPSAVKPLSEAEQKARREQANRHAVEAAAKVQRFGVGRESLPKGHTTVKFKDADYHYHGGYWYFAGGGKYFSMIPPHGIAAPNLPGAAKTIKVGKQSYQYFNGSFYTRVSDKEFKVVDPPIGAAVTALPVEAKAKTIGDKQYLVFDKAYYQAAHRGTDVVYQVVEAPSE